MTVIKLFFPSKIAVKPLYKISVQILMKIEQKFCSMVLDHTQTEVHGQRGSRLTAL